MRAVKVGLSVLLSTAVLPSSAQAKAAGPEPTYFQKHYIGERAADFLQDEPAVRGRIDDCRDIDINPKAWLDKYGESQEAALPHISKHPSVYEQQLIESTNRLRVTLLAGIKQDFGCDELAAAFERAGEANIRNQYYDHATSTTFYETPGIYTMWTFSGGALTGIEIEFGDATYGQVKEDASKKLGDPPRESQLSRENGFGATWNDLEADWLTPALHAHLEQRNNPASKWLRLTVESRSDFNAKMQKEMNRPSSLD